MKKFKKLGRVLTKDEMKKLTGGQLWPQSGYRLDGSQCYCDFSDPNMQSLPICDEPCSILCCYESLPCSLEL
jgi:hypothetical protein